jgi:peptidoglycan LD-endopeptidase CwlK
MNVNDALRGSTAPEEIKSQLSLVEVPYLDFKGEAQTGRLVVHSDLADEVKEIFKKLLEISFPIEKIRLPVEYGWDDHASMSDNNTSSFNWRMIEHTSERSWHSYGRAIDINPRTNPYYGYKGVEPAGAVYDPEAIGAITGDGPVVRIFKEYGWEWLGERNEHKDYQHFQKPL